MGKYTVYGEVCFNDQDGTEWNADVELNEEQARNLQKLIIFNCDIDVERLCLKETFPDIYDILDKACYKATLDAYNEYLRSNGKSEVDKLDFKHEVNVPYEFQELF
jgi:hypothetical protein